MSSVMIKDIPPELHRRLRSDAKRHHRSMTKHVIAILEDILSAGEAVGDTRPVTGRFPLTDEWLNLAKREGRP